MIQDPNPTDDPELEKFVDWLYRKHANQRSFVDLMAIFELGRMRFDSSVGRKVTAFLNSNKPKPSKAFPPPATEVPPYDFAPWTPENPDQPESGKWHRIFCGNHHIGNASNYEQARLICEAHNASSVGAGHQIDKATLTSLRLGDPEP